MDYLQEMQDLLKEKNMEERKQENLLNSQKDNWYFSLFFPKGSEKSLPFFIYSTYKFLIFLVIYFQTIKKIIIKDDL